MRLTGTCSMKSRVWFWTESVRATWSCSPPNPARDNADRRRPPSSLLRRCRAFRVSSGPFLALVILEGGDHRAVAALGDALRQPVLPRDHPDLGDDFLDPGRGAD